MDAPGSRRKCGTGVGLTVTNHVVLGSRRSLEYRPDDLRLSMLSTPSIMEAVRQAFGFQQSQIGTPIPTFGDVQASLPPGVVFDVGSLVAQDGQPISIRFLHFEFARIVVDIAAPSQYLEEVFERLDVAVKTFSAPDGRPIIGSPYATADQSDVSAHLGFAPEVLVHPTLNALIRSKNWSTMEGDEFLPSVSLRLQATGSDFQPPRFASDMWMLQLRGGTNAHDRQYFSSAPLRSDDHIALLERLDEAMSEE